MDIEALKRLTNHPLLNPRRKRLGYRNPSESVFDLIRGM
jgi:hypothetical protein